jgi:Flp pilus assembly protein TadD
VPAALLAGAAALAQHPADSTSAQVLTAFALAEKAREMARSGASHEALPLYEKAVEMAPREMAIWRDYAVVLGWANKYPESIRAFERVWRAGPEQPMWAQREYARSQLFGGRTAEALATLNSLVERGDLAESTLARRALALRWLGRSREAETAYGDLLLRHPGSESGMAGMVNSLADRDRLQEALRACDEFLAQKPGSLELLKSRARILNWMGRHQEALRVLAPLPEDREVLELRTQAARWAGNPTLAVNSSRRLEAVFPAAGPARAMRNEVDLEYGYSVSAGARYVSDSDGFVDRMAGAGFGFHVNPAHGFTVGGLYRSFSQAGVEDGVREWRRFEASWSGVLYPRVSAYASGSSVDYLSQPGVRRLLGDAALNLAPADQVRLSGGGGRIAMDSFWAVDQAITAVFGYGSLTWMPDPLTGLEARYARYTFSDGVTRDRADLDFGRRVFTRPALRLRLGARSSLMWHDRESPHFYSPSSFATLLFTAQATGRWRHSLEHFVEVGTGVQKEPGIAWQIPITAAARFTWKLSAGLALTAEAAASTSSLERLNPGRAAYTRMVAAASLTYRCD